MIVGCKYAEQPARVEALERRLDKVAAAVSELSGEPGPGSAAIDPKHKGKQHEAGKSAAKAKAKAKAKAADAHGDAADHEPAPRANAAPHGGAAAPAAAAALATPHGDVHWEYGGANGPPHWADLAPAFATCASGSAQSPVDILPRPGAAPEVFLIYRPTRGVVVDNGHTLQVNLDPGNFAIVDGVRFDLLQFHVHTPSEHTIAGEAFPLEVHLVHRDRSGALAVVGVLFDEGAPSPAMAPVWKGAPRAKGGERRLERPFDPGGLLPRDHGAYRYDGSLTTPPCSEGVRWIVLKRSRTEDRARIAAFRKRFGDNARPVQALGEREVH